MPALISTRSSNTSLSTSRKITCISRNLKISMPACRQMDTDIRRKTKRSKKVKVNLRTGLPGEAGNIKTQRQNVSSL